MLSKFPCNRDLCFYVGFCIHYNVFHKKLSNNIHKINISRHSYKICCSSTLIVFACYIVHISTSFSTLITLLSYFSNRHLSHSFSSPTPFTLRSDIISRKLHSTMLTRINTYLAHSPYSLSETA